MKLCGKCQIEKPVVEFNKYKKNPDGLQAYCRQCNKQYHSKWYQTNKEHVDSKRTKHRKENPEQETQIRRKWEEKNREKRNQQHRDYRKTPNGRAIQRKHNIKRRALEKNAFVEEIPQEYIDSLLVRQNSYCRYCLVDFNLEPYTVEHILPLQRGGLNERNNIALLCKSCNSSKLAKTHKEYLEFKKERRKLCLDV